MIIKNINRPKQLSCGTSHCKSLSPFTPAINMGLWCPHGYPIIQLLANHAPPLNMHFWQHVTRLIAVSSACRVNKNNTPVKPVENCIAIIRKPLFTLIIIMVLCTFLRWTCSYPQAGRTWQNSCCFAYC